MTVSIIRGTYGDDNLGGTSCKDEFLMFQRGNDTVSGGDGNDVFRFGATLTAADHIDGGNDNDTVILNGDYSSGLVFAADTMVNVETLSVIGNFSYNLASDNATVAASATLVVKANGLAAGHSLTFDGSAETDGHFRFAGSTGDDALTGGAKADIFRLENGGNDTVHGGGGHDFIAMGNAFTAADQLDGGSGNDTVSLTASGTMTVTFGATTMVNVETLLLADTGAYNFTSDDATIAAGATLTVDASALTLNAHSVAFDGSAETDGNFHLIAGQSDTFEGGAGNDIFDLTRAQEAFVLGGGGDDTFLVAGNYNSGNLYIDGGGGSNSMEFDGDYANLQLDPIAGLGNIQKLVFDAGHSVDHLNVVNTISGGLLTVDASQLTTAMVASFAGQAVAFEGGSGAEDVSFTGTASQAAASTFHGGGGSDTLELVNDYSSLFPFGAAALTGIETLIVRGTFSFDLAINDANVASGATLTVDASSLTGSHTLTFDGSAETDGHFTFLGGAADDTLTGGSLSDSFTGGGGADTFVFTAVSQSTSVNHDHVTDFAAGTDRIDTTVAVSAVFATPLNHSISAATFDSDLSAANDDQLIGKQAWIVHASGGDLIGRDFLVVDADNNSHYDAGSDYVIEITGYTGTISTADFI